MRTELRAVAIALFAAALTISGGAQAAFIAGWDFSQYAGQGSLQVSEDPDTADPINADTLRSNYSDYDPTFGAGGDSQDAGTMYINGQFGSTNVDENATIPVFRALAGSLTNNVTLPGSNEVPVGDVNFNASSGVLQVAAGNYLAGTGQDFNVTLSMIATATVDAVFAAHVSAVDPGMQGSNWSLSFAARTASGTASVGLEFSTDGSDWTVLAPADLTTTDTLFTRDVLGEAGENGYFRMRFTSTGTPRIDNVTISGDITPIPEPGTAMLMLLGLTGLGVVGRRRA
jgi:hypothetical protein